MKSKKKGYQGSITVVRDFVQPRRAKRYSTLHTTVPNHPDLLEMPPSPRSLAHLITGEPQALTVAEKAFLTTLKARNPTLATVIELGCDFVDIIRQRQPARLNAWLFLAKQSQFRPLRNFALGICQDYSAVRAGLSLSYSNGPTEGFVNKLKVLKRQMYGRAKIDLLRARLIAI